MGLGVSGTPLVCHSQIILWNARGFSSKLGEFKSYIYDKLPLIICVTDTRLSQRHNIKLRNYNIVRDDRMDGYGSLAIFTDKTLKVKPFNLAVYNSGFMQMLSLKYANVNV